MKQKIYIDTSVVGGCFDAEFENDSKIFFDQVRIGKIQLIVSDVLSFELEGAPEKVKKIIPSLPVEHLFQVLLDEESNDLARAYLMEGAVMEKSISDARHIALATVHHADVLVSWNFKHIVNVNRIHLYNAVNLKLGYPLIEIRSPKEIIYEQ